VQICISIRSAGASPLIGEMLRFSDFFRGYTYSTVAYFFSGTQPDDIIAEADYYSKKIFAVL